MEKTEYKNENEKNSGSLWREAIERNCIYVQSGGNWWPVVFAICSKRKRFIFRAYATCFDVTGKVFFWLINFFNEQCLLFTHCSFGLWHFSICFFAATKLYLCYPTVCTLKCADEKVSDCHVMFIFMEYKQRNGDELKANHANGLNKKLIFLVCVRNMEVPTFSRCS